MIACFPLIPRRHPTSDDYTPTRGEVFDAWIEAWFDYGSDRERIHEREEAKHAELERFFVEHDRQVAETAWDEAARAVIEFEESVISDHPTNPYRSIALLGAQEESKA